MIERRFPRATLRVPLFITVGGGRLYEKAIPIECRDISGGGLSFETHTEIPVNSTSKLVVGRLGNLPANAIIEGRVVYRVKQKGEERYTIGVEFVDFVNTSRDELIKRIHDWLDNPKSFRKKSGH